jgi:glycerol uptake facilitator-like aquaporin
MLLAAAVIGSGIMAQRLTGDGAVALLANTLATVAALAVLITLPVAASYVVAQLSGCCLGALMAHAMFELPMIQTATHSRAGIGQLLSEMVATAGLITVAFSSTTPKEAAWRVAAWIGAAYWFTGSTSFANPAITVARSLSDTFAGIRPADVPAFIAAQMLGALAGLAVTQWLFASNTHECREADAARE